MNGFRELLVRITSPDALWIALWVGLGVFTLVLIALLHTRLGRSKPLQKCTILAVWFHLLLLIYATSVQVVRERPGGGNQVTINLAAGAVADPADSTKPTTKPKLISAASIAVPDVLQTLRSAPPRAVATERKAPTPKPMTPISKSASVIDVPAPRAAAIQPPVAGSAISLPDRIEAPRAETRPPKQPTAKPNVKPQVADVAKSKLPAATKPAAADALTPISKPATLADVPDPLRAVAKPPPSSTTATTATPAVSAPAEMTRIPQPQDLASVARPSPEAPAAARLMPIVAPPALNAPPAMVKVGAHQTPQIYQQRVVADKQQVVAAHGGSDKTEAAVNAALKWLAAHQEPDGRWSPRRFGAGQESEVLGHNRGGAGAQADTGITGLALLALLGAGHTNARGDYKNTVENALAYLIAAQHPNGNLGGEAEPFAFMYCHGMATLALSEALAMTGDERLEEPVRRAIGYTLSAQNRVTGGWRYRPMESGDLSQLGWQLMALKSAELAGIETPSQTRDGMVRFVQGVSSGAHGGLASYRAGERVSRPMTAEGLVCKQFLGLPRQNPAGEEAGDFLLDELPGQGERNYYYWYYGTLGMYQLQGDHWRRWNAALTSELLNSQIVTGELSGTWDSNDVWGGYGGRVYSTALATLCLEVYYRYLPLYVEAAANGGDSRLK